MDLQPYLGQRPAKEDTDHRKAAQQWYFNATTAALHSKLFPSKVMFEGANKNLIVYRDLHMKNELFGFSNGTEDWFNEATKRGIMVQNHDPSQLAPGANIATAKINKKNEPYQRWLIVPCNGKDQAEAEKEHEAKKKKKKKAAKKKATEEKKSTDTSEESASGKNETESSTKEQTDASPKGEAKSTESAPDSAQANDTDKADAGSNSSSDANDTASDGNDTSAAANETISTEDPTKDPEKEKNDTIKAQEKAKQEEKEDQDEEQTEKAKDDGLSPVEKTEKKIDANVKAKYHEKKEAAVVEKASESDASRSHAS